MMDFKAALRNGLSFAEKLTESRIEIREVLRKFSIDVFEGTQSVVSLTFRRSDFVSALALDDYFSSVVDVTTGANEGDAFFIDAYSKGSNKTYRLAYFTWTKINGYPCMLEFDGARYVCGEASELETSLKTLLESPFVSQKIFNLMNEK